METEVAMAFMVVPKRDQKKKGTLEKKIARGRKKTLKETFAEKMEIHRRK